MSKLRRSFIKVVFSLYLTLTAQQVNAWKMEVGTVVLPATSGVTALFPFNFQQSYDVAPVVVALLTRSGGDTTALRINNITTTGFAIAQVESPSENGPHVGMTISYMAIEPGVHTFPGGQIIEAGTADTTTLQFSGLPGPAPPGTAIDTEGWVTQNFAHAGFIQPTVLAAIQTTNNEPGIQPRNPSTPWMTAAVNNITNSSVDLALERSEEASSRVGANYYFDPLGSNETLGYVAISSGINGNFTANGNVPIIFETVRSAGVVEGWDNGCRSVAYGTTYASAPITLATKSSHNEDDGGWLRECSRNTSSISLTIDEDQGQDGERNHIAEDVSLIAFSQSFSFDSNASSSSTNAAFMLEAGDITLSPSSFTTINLEQEYEAPPAIFLLEDSNNPEPSSVRVRNVTTTSFEVVPVEPDSRVADAADQSTTIDYLVVSKGQHQFPDGTSIEVQDYDFQNFQSKRLAGDSWFGLNFFTGKSAIPAMLTNIQTMNNESAHTPGSPSQPWMTTAVRNVTTNGAQIALDRAETNSGLLNQNENVAYLAIEPGVIGDFNDAEGNVISSESQRTADNVAGTTSCYNYSYLGSYSSTPLVIGSQMTWDGGDGGWLRRCETTTTSSLASVRIEEDWALDTDNAHTTERAGFLAFSNSFYADFSLVANYQLEGPTWNGSANEVIDSSGNGLDGRRIGDANPQPAQVCYGASFDGDGDSIEINDDPLLDIDEELTVMAWVNIDSLPSSDLYTIISKDTNFEFHVNTSGQIYWWWNTSGGTARSFDSGGFSVTPGAWHHIAIVYSLASGEQRIVVDGVDRGTATFTGESLATNSIPLNIGVDYVYPSRAFPGRIDEVRIYSRALTTSAIGLQAAKTRPCPSCALNRFEITQPTYSLACPETRAQVTIEAQCADTSTKTDYVGTVNLTAPAGGTFYDAATGGNVITSLSYLTSDVGSKTAYLYFNDENSNVQVNANDTSASVSTTAITGTDFRAFGFNVTTQPSNMVCGDATTAVLTAFGRTNNTAGAECEVITGFGGSKSLDVWFRATVNDDVVQDPVTTNMSLNGTLITEQSSSADGNLDLSFVNGVGTVNVEYPNAANILDLNFRFDEVPYDGSEFSAMAASTNSFVVRPDTFALSASSSGTALNATTANGTPTHAAGQPFDLSVTAECSDGSVATEYQPNADSNTLAVYLQQTGPTGGGAVSGDLQLSASKILTSNQSTTISWESADINASSFVNGVYTYGAASFDEVGLLRLHVRDEDYFSQVVSATNLDIGRFTPDHFNVLTSNGSLQASCNSSAPGFSYSGQTFNYASLPQITIQARNANNAITQNYTETGYRKLQSSDVTRSFPTSDASQLGADSTNLVDLNVSAFAPINFNSSTNGVMTFLFDAADSFTYAKNDNAQVNLFTSDVEISVTDITDSDSITSSDLPIQINPTGIQIAFGRWNLENAFGPETIDLPIPASVERWNGARFVANTQDNCTVFDATNLIDTEALTGGTTSPSGSGTVVNSVANQLELSAPGAGNTGAVQLEYQGADWLRFDWDSNPLTPFSNATSEAIFGRYRGHDRIIYWREVSN